MKKQWSVTALGFLLAVFFIAAPARGDDVDKRIQTLEDELNRLKSEQAQVKAEQIEMRKDATAAAAALPNFSYTPGSGMLIEAADKSWSLRSSLEAHFRLLFESGHRKAGRETATVMGRRLRTEWYYCINDCFYEWVIRLDLDGFGTGNAKNSTNTGGSSILQRGIVDIKFSKLNPWLPNVQTGMDGPAQISANRAGSSSTGAQLEYDLLSRNNGFNTGRWGNGFNIYWQDLDLSRLGIPGRIPLASVTYASVGEGDDGLQSFRTHYSEALYFSIEPFSKLDNKWIKGLNFEMGAWLCTVDTNNGGNISGNATQNPINGCGDLNIRDNGDGGRQSLYAAPTAGKGLTHFLMPGFAWTVGPYRLRAVGGFQRYKDGKEDGFDSPAPGRKWANVFLIGHDIYLWSPKGFLTGSSTQAGSILFGTHFERTDAACGIPGCASDGTFSRTRILVREWDLWYFLANRMSVGGSMMWFDASNLPAIAQKNLGITNIPGGIPGKGGKWIDYSITFRYQF